MVTNCSDWRQSVKAVVLGTCRRFWMIEGVGQKRVAMGMCARLLRAVGFVALLVVGFAFGVTVVTVPGGSADAQSASSIVIEGNRRVEAETIRSYFKPSRRGIERGPDR